MPTIDVTNPVIAGLNAASGALGGAAQGYLAGLTHNLRERAVVEDADYRNRLLRARLSEMEQRAGEQERAFGLDERGLRVKERALDEDINERRRQRADLDLGADYVARITESKFGAGKVQDFEDAIAAQRAAAVRFAAGLSPAARALVLAGVDDDERAERRALAQRAAKASWEGVLSNPQLAQDASGMAEELRALATESIDALESGAISPAESMRDLDQLRTRVAEFTQKQRTYQWGLNWADQQIAEGGSDIEGMQRALSDYEAMGPDGANLRDLKRDLLRAKHGLDMDAVKLGKVTVPRSVRPGSREWLDIASGAADEEAVELMARDPLLKQKIDNGDFDDDDGMRKYLDIRETYRRSIMRKYAGQSGLSRGQMSALGLLEDPAQVQRGAEEAIRRALKEAGINPDQKIEARPAPVTPEQRRRTPEGYSPNAQEAPPRAGMLPSGAPMLENLDTATRNAALQDNEFNEADIEAVYGDG